MIIIIIICNAGCYGWVAESDSGQGQSQGQDKVNKMKKKKMIGCNILNQSYSTIMIIVGNFPFRLSLCLAFIAVHRQLNRWPCPWLSDWLPEWQHFWFLTPKSNPGDLWPLRPLIRAMRKHDLTNILTILTIKIDNLAIFLTIFHNFVNFDNFW